MKGFSTSKFSAIGFIVTIGIVFGDLGTSPLYVMKAITGASEGRINPDFILGALSCIIWTLTLQTTFKYMLIALRADNHGEGGILALYSLIKNSKKSKILYIVAIIGAAALVSDGIITPPMTIISAVEGLQVYQPNIKVAEITTIILIILFSIQQFGTKSIGKFFGPVMTLWFLMLAVFGAINISSNISVFKAFDPYYAFVFLQHSPNTLLILGAVFLCTTGAEALYSDLGHCGLKNIRISWIFVKICLIISYLGQGAWVLSNVKTALIPNTNPFFMMIPSSFLGFGIIMATLAAIIASQALISGSYTIFSEAMSLNFFPRQKIEYPELNQGQMYIPKINWAMMVLCIFVVQHFKSSSAMEAAYGFAITITMLMTTILLIYYLYYKKYNIIIVAIFGIVYGIIEVGFFCANAMKFMEGGYIAIFLALIISIFMYAWHNGQRLKKKYVKYVKIHPYLSVIEDIKDDKNIPKYASNLIYISNAKRNDEIDAKIMFSIISKHPKRADNYWFVYVKYDNNPFTFEYEIIDLAPNIRKVKIVLGYKIQPNISIYFSQIIEELNKDGEFDMLSNYKSLRKHDIPADFTYIVIDRVFAHHNFISFREKFILRLFNLIKHIGITDTTAWGLDSYNVVREKVPITTKENYDKGIRIKRKEITV